jgi:hypothetical protein
VVFSVQLAWIGAFGSPLPRTDDWRIPQWLLLPLVTGQLDALQLIEQLFRPHNEHRIFLMRLVALVSFGQNNQQWDIMVMLLMNAVVLSATVAIVLVSHQNHLPIISAIFVVLLLTVPNHLPATLLWYFGLGWYFFLFFSVAAIYLNLTSTTLRLRWWLSVLCAFMAFFGVASVGALLALFLKECKNIVFRFQPLRSLAAAIIIAAITYYCIKLTYGGGASSFTGNLFMSIFSFDFIASFIKEICMGLVWPYVYKPQSLIGLFLYAPLAVYFFRALMWPSKTESYEMKMGAYLAFFYLCHLTIICFGRGYPNEDRYMELPPFGIIGNFLILLGFFRQALRTKYQFISFFTLCVWVATVAYGLSGLWITDQLEVFKKSQENSIEATKQFLVDLNAEAYAKSPHVPFPPHVSAETIDAMIKLQPYKVFSYHYYLPEPYTQLDSGQLYSLWREGKVGILSFVTWILIRCWQGVLLAGVSVSFYAWFLANKNTTHRN